MPWFLTLDEPAFADTAAAAWWLGQRTTIRAFPPVPDYPGRVELFFGQHLDARAYASLLTHRGVPADAIGLRPEPDSLPDWDDPRQTALDVDGGAA